MGANTPLHRKYRLSNNEPLKNSQKFYSSVQECKRKKSQMGRGSDRANFVQMGRGGKVPKWHVRKLCKVPKWRF